MTEAKNSCTGLRDSPWTPWSSTSVIGDDDGAALVELATSSIQSSDFAWSTFGEHGKVSDWHNVRAMIDRVGSSARWTYLVVLRADDRRVFAQCCGNARTGLVVELSTDLGSKLVVAEGTVCVDGHQVGNAAWPYFANDMELHTPAVAIEIFFEWLVHGHLLAGMELQPQWGIPDQ